MEERSPGSYRLSIRGSLLRSPFGVRNVKLYLDDFIFTDAGGNLVYRTTSNGGTAHWDGKTLSGERVKAGVYFIWTAPNEGEGRKVGEFVVIN